MKVKLANGRIYHLRINDKEEFKLKISIFCMNKDGTWEQRHGTSSEEIIRICSTYPGFYIQNNIVFDSETDKMIGEQLSLV